MSVHMYLCTSERVCSCMLQPPPTLPIKLFREQCRSLTSMCSCTVSLPADAKRMISDKHPCSGSTSISRILNKPEPRKLLSFLREYGHSVGWVRKRRGKHNNNMTTKRQQHFFQVQQRNTPTVIQEQQYTPTTHQPPILLPLLHRSPYTNNRKQQ
jgi:hypothetical protein